MSASLMRRLASHRDAHAPGRPEESALENQSRSPMTMRDTRCLLVRGFTGGLDPGLPAPPLDHSRGGKLMEDFLVP